MGQGGRDTSMNVGYNKENVEGIGGYINEVAQQSATKIVSEINTQIVEGLAPYWYSEIAVEYFQNFANIVNDKSADVTKVFQQFNDRMRIAGNNWATATNGETPNMPDIDQVTLTIDISPIKAIDTDGSRYISNEIESVATQAVENAKSNIQSFIEEQVAYADASLAFFGEGQSEAIKEAAKNLGTEVDNLLAFLTEGNDAIVAKATEYNESYKQTASTNNEQFSDSGF